MLNSTNIAIVDIEWQSPETIARSLHDLPGFVWLDTANEPQSGFSFIAIDPFEKISYKNGVMRINDQLSSDDFLSYLERRLKQYKISSMDNIPFVGGAIGYLGYEFSRALERLPQANSDPLSCSDAHIGFYDCVIVFDHQKRTCQIVSTGFPEDQIENQKRRALARAQMLQAALKRKPMTDVWMGLICPPAAEDSKEAYISKVEKVQEYIRSGDVFEVNLSTRFWGECQPNAQAFSLYLQMRNINGGPYSAFYKTDDIELLSVSPEQFISLNGQTLRTFPIKGTRPRSDCPEEDESLANALKSSEKDRAENIMIVDLMRNDFSKISTPDSVKVKQLCALHSFATVHHLISEVSAILPDEKGPVDAIRACFPAGSITGAPKIRTMEIIAQLENSTRGPYCGSMLYIGFDQKMDSSVLIRTLVKKNNYIFFGAGGAITIDSCPLEEYEEVQTKASGIKRSLVCEGG